MVSGLVPKVENLEHAVLLHFMHDNFARIHKTLRVTPAMAEASAITSGRWKTIARFAE